MTDERVDALIRRLAVAADADPAFASRSLVALLPPVRKARAQDGTRIGRLRREVRAGLAWRPMPWGSWPAESRLVALILVGLLIATTVLIGIVASARRLPAPIGLAANGRIAYVADGHIYTTDPDGANRQQVTSGAGTEFAPTFSPDGTRLAYRRFYPGEPLHDPQLADVVVADADGAHEVVLERKVKGVSNVSWSPDSGFLAYSRASAVGVDHSWVVAADGSAAPVDLGTFSDGSWGPTWSPDGQRLALAAEQSLWVVNRDGSGRQKLTHGDYGEVGSKGEAAEWSPDGTTLVFSVGDPGGDHKVCVVGLDGIRERVISRVQRQPMAGPGRPMERGSRTCGWASGPVPWS